MIVWTPVGFELGCAQAAESGGPPRQIILRRLRAEFMEMPGLSLTPPQAERLCGASAHSHSERGGGKGDPGGPHAGGLLPWVVRAPDRALTVRDAFLPPSVALGRFVAGRTAAQRPLQAELLHPVNEGAARKPQIGGRTRLVPAVFLQRGDQ